MKIRLELIRSDFGVGYLVHFKKDDVMFITSDTAYFAILYNGGIHANKHRVWNSHENRNPQNIQFALRWHTSLMEQLLRNRSVFNYGSVCGKVSLKPVQDWNNLLQTGIFSSIMFTIEVAEAGYRIYGGERNCLALPYGEQHTGAVVPDGSLSGFEMQGVDPYNAGLLEIGLGYAFGDYDLGSKVNMHEKFEPKIKTLCRRFQIELNNATI